MTENRHLTKKKGELYSLWIKPENEVHDVLTRIINTLADQYKSPRFEPHVTVAGSITNPVDDIIKSMEKVAAGIRPMTLYLTETGYTDTIYKSLFIHIAPNETLLELRDQCITELNKEHEPYIPHISLLYKELNTEAKQQIIDRIGKRFDLVFIPDKLYLVRTTGHPESWDEIHQVSLIK